MLRRILNARVGEVLPTPTPLEKASGLSERVGRPMLLKREDLTPVFSFKLRGAYNRICRLTPEQAAHGVIAASAGNHAQGVAFSCQALGIACRIVMPRTTPAIKVRAVERLGARIALVGDSYSDAAAYAAQVAHEEGLITVEPFDDLDVIAGQGTIGLELLSQAPEATAAVFVPVGGGGLAAGVAAVWKEVRPKTLVIGVEPDDSNAMGLSLAAGKILTLDEVGIFADGVAVKRVGDETFALCRRYLDGVVTVDTDEICTAIRDVFLDTRTMLEPAGALAIAGAKKWCSTHPGDTPVVAIASGANVAYQRFGYIVERSEMGEHREALLAVSIPEQQGSFMRFVDSLGERTVTEFNYRMHSRLAARIFVGVEVRDANDVVTLKATLDGLGYETLDLSRDDIAKTHVRHMVGGLSTEAQDEVLYEFVFPERPGALRSFLHTLGGRWNISLFHYRNHGAAFGRVLCGLEVAPTERSALVDVLDAIGFRYQDVTLSPAAAFLI